VLLIPTRIIFTASKLDTKAILVFTLLGYLLLGRLEMNLSILISLFLEVILLLKQLLKLTTVQRLVSMYISAVRAQLLTCSGP